MGTFIETPRPGYRLRYIHIATLVSLLLTFLRGARLRRLH